MLRIIILLTVFLGILNCSKDYILSTISINTDDFYLARILYVFNSSSTVDSQATNSNPLITTLDSKITVTKTTYFSIELSWKPFVEPTNPQDQFIYTIYSSLSNKLSTLEAINEYGELVDSVVNETSHSIYGLSSSTIYNINIIVEDPSGQKLIYSGTSQKTSADKNYIFPGSETMGKMGEEGGRLGADKNCRNIYESNANFQSQIQCNNIHAFISIDSNDEIRDLPDNYYFPSELEIDTLNISDLSINKIANNLNDALDGSLTHSLLSLDSIETVYWTGSNMDGSINNDNCNNFQSQSQPAIGKLGNNYSVDGAWLEASSLYCDDLLPILCACF